ncbi:MAG: ribonuclease III [Clostridiales bacterium]|nr:ribonuclease III [Clostridiales bacterium]
MMIVNGFEFKSGAEELSSLALAYIGDSVFEIYARSYVLSLGNRSVDKINSEVRNIVNAHSQSEMYHKLEPFLTEEEFKIMKRGRNANSHTMAKNQSAGDYRRATGLEALFGRLYIEGKTERLTELFKLGIKKEKGDENG